MQSRDKISIPNFEPGSQSQEFEELQIFFAHPLKINYRIYK